MTAFLIFAIPIDTNEYHTDMRTLKYAYRTSNCPLHSSSHPKELISWMGAMGTRLYNGEMGRGYAAEVTGIQAVEKPCIKGKYWEPT